MPKQLAVILGMHRSGTSLITKSMELVGYELGDNLMPERGDNPKGFFEDVDFVELNDELLRASSSTWEIPQLSTASRDIDDKKLIKRADKFLKDKFKGRQKLALKDPRACLLLPLWQKRFEAYEIEARYIVVHRDPVEVAASLARRNGFSLRHGLLLDYLYSREIMAFAGADAFVINYAAFMREPTGQIARLAGYLGEEIDEAAVAAFANDFVDSSLWHHKADAANTDDMFPELAELSGLMYARAADQAIELADYFNQNPVSLALEHELLGIEVTRLVKLLFEREQRETAYEKSVQELDIAHKLALAEVDDRQRRLEERETHVALLAEQIKGFENDLARANAALLESDDQLAEKARHIALLNESVGDARQAVEARDVQIAERENHVASLQQEVSLFEDQLKASQQVVADRDSQVADRDAHIAALQAEVDDFTASLVKANDALADRDQQVAERESHIEILHSQVHSLGDQLQESNNILKIRDDEHTAAGEAYRRQETLLESERQSHQAVVEQFDQQIHQLQHESESARGRQAETESRLRDAQLHQAEQGMEIANQKAAIDQLNAVHGKYQQQLADYAEQVRGYQHHVDDYDRLLRDMHSSVSYRLGRILTYPVRKPFNALILPRFASNPASLRLLGFVRNCVSHPVKTLQLLSWKRIRNFYRLMTQRQDLVDQVVTNYEDVLNRSPADEVTTTPAYPAEALGDFQLTLPASDNPAVSVLIPVYNQLDYTLQCLQSIADNPPGVPIEVVVADDCSNDATEEVLAGIKGLRVVRHPENLKFLLSVNRAVDFCRGDYIFLLNNDTVVKPGWLDTLVQVFDEKPDAGIVGSKLVYPDGRLQEAGGIVWQDGSAWNFGRMQDAEAPEYNYLRETDYISGAAIMFPRQLFLDLGKFDEQLVPAYYEDTDLAFKMREAGRKVYYQPESEVVHFEGISHGTDETAGLKQYQVANFEKFEAKWRHVLTDHFPNAEQVFVARERAQARTTVLVIDHYVPHFDKDAGSRSTYLYLKLLCEAGCNVKFIGDNFYQHEPYTSVLQQMGIEVLYGNHYYNNWKTWLRENCEHIDVIYLMRPHITEVYIDFINALPHKPRTIYFGHDLHYLRLERQAELSQDPEVRAEAESWHKKEFELFDKVDLIYYPSEIEVQEIHRERPDLPVKAIPLYAYENFSDHDVDFSTRKGILFVGGFNHPPNADGLTWFVESVLPLVIAETPDICLHVVGSNMPDDIAELEGHHVQVHGFLTDEELDDLYRSVRLSIVPLRFGAGIKGKVLEAMDYGVPVVTTHVGAEGIPDAQDCLLIEEEADHMAATINRVYADDSILANYSDRARNVVQNSFSTQAVLRVIADDFMIRLS